MLPSPERKLQSLSGLESTLFRSCRCRYAPYFVQVRGGRSYGQGSRREIMTRTTEGKLAGQVALITGASSGIGWAIARAFLDEGADLVVVARRSEQLQALADEAQKSGRRCLVVIGDTREEETAIRAVRAALEQLGHLDILVNNVGIGRYADLIQTSVEDYD